MAKGIILVDIPKSCYKCRFVIERTWCVAKGNDVYDYIQNQIKPDWCPINLLPERVHHENYCDNGRYDKGWNDCLNEVLGIDK